MRIGPGDPTRYDRFQARHPPAIAGETPESTWSATEAGESPGAETIEGSRTLAGVTGTEEAAAETVGGEEEVRALPTAPSRLPRFLGDTS